MHFQNLVNIEPKIRRLTGCDHTVLSQVVLMISQTVYLIMKTNLLICSQSLATQCLFYLFISVTHKLLPHYIWQACCQTFENVRFYCHPQMACNRARWDQMALKHKRWISCFKMLPSFIDCTWLWSFNPADHTRWVLISQNAYQLHFPTCR